MPLQPGHSLDNGQYIIRSLLGRGGFGFVYLADDALLHEQIALKELIPALVGDEEILRRFLAEARATMRLTHERIVRTHNVFAERGNYYIAMEYMAGGSLEALLKEPGALLPVEEAVRVAAEVCEGLAHAHERGVVHCDPKPANVLFDDRGHAKIADFGIAHIPAEMLSRSWNTQAGFVAGTLPYMSPEQADGVRDDPRVDVYAVGAVLYRMLTGRPYLEFDLRDTPSAQARNVGLIQTTVPVSPSAHNGRVPAWLDSVVLKALAKRPEGRYGSAAELREAVIRRETPRVAERLAGLPAAETVIILPQPEAEPPVPHALLGTRPAWFWPGVVGAAALLVLVVALFLWSGGVGHTGETRVVATARPEAAVQPNETQIPAGAMAPAAAPTATPVEKPTLKVVWETANLRSGPGTNYPLLGQLTVCQSYEITGRNAAGDWWQFVYNGDPAWVSRAMVTASGDMGAVEVTQNIPLPPTETSSRQSTETLMPTVTFAHTAVLTGTPVSKPMFTVKQAVVDVRSGPGTNYPVISQLKTGQSYEIASKNAAGDWWQFDANGKPAWVAAALVQSEGAEAVKVAASIPKPPPSPLIQAQPTPKPTATPKRALGIGSTMVSEKDGMVLSYVPAGKFLMGAVEGDVDAGLGSDPQHRVYLDAYWIDKTEVTNGQYAKCVATGACQAPKNRWSAEGHSYYGDSQYNNYPVMNVSWKDAQAYCAWAGRRLPSEAEWEKAARGSSDVRPYPWGDQTPTCALANFSDYDGTGHECVGDTSAVGSYPAGASPYGALDMAGNLMEWVNDWYDYSYYGISPGSAPPGPATGTVKVLRGGYFGGGARQVRVDDRDTSNPAQRNSLIGFRCAVAQGS